MSYAVMSASEFTGARKAPAVPFNWRLATALGFNAAAWALGLATTIQLGRALNLL